MYSSHRCIKPYIQCWRVLYLFLFFALIDCLCHPSNVRLCTLSSTSLVLWSINWSYFLGHLKNGSKWVKKGTSQVFITVMRSLLQSLVLRNFHVPVLFFYLFVYQFHLSMFDGVRFQILAVFLYFERSDFFEIRQFYSSC